MAQLTQILKLLRLHYQDFIVSVWHYYFTDRYFSQCIVQLDKYWCNVCYLLR